MDSGARSRRTDEIAQDGILILDAETGTILDSNPFLARMLNCLPADLLGKTLWEIGFPKDADASKRAFQELIDEGSVRYDHLPLFASDGRGVRVEVTGIVHQVNGENVVQCNIRGIGQRKETARKEDQTRQTREVEAVGQIAGGLAHDLNNLLGVILRYCEILEGQVELPEASRKTILEMHAAGASAKNLAQRLLGLSRGQAVQRVALDLNEAVNNMKKMLGRLIGDDVELRILPGDGVGRINADPSQLEQVLMNLVINARDAMPKGGRILVETANVLIDETNAAQHSSIRPGRYVLLTVSDTGTGMDKETQSRIFEPFFTTKPFGQGTGLGLTTVLSIVEQNGGAIAVNSEPGAGATFRIHFPRSDGAPKTMKRAKDGEVDAETETILLVDDSNALRGLMRRLLEESGYTVIDSGDPAVALSIAGEHSGAIPLMITDVVLPGFSGTDLAARVTQSRPETKVLYVSGYNDDSIASLRLPGQDYAFLSKPFTQDELLREVRQLLDSSMKVIPRAAPRSKTGDSSL